jgi:hypothetical protein
MDQHSALRKLLEIERDPLLSAKGSASVVKLRRVPMAIAPWIVSDELWELVEPLLRRRCSTPRSLGR